MPKRICRNANILVSEETPIGDISNLTKKPFVISIASISGGGKTTVTTSLKERLINSFALYWDDYGDEVYLNRDINEWAADGCNHNEWYTEPFAIDVEGLLAKPYDYL